MDSQNIIKELESVSKMILQTQQNCKNNVDVNFELGKINIHIKYIVAMIDTVNIIELLTNPIDFSKNMAGINDNFAVGTGSINTGQNN